MGEGNKTHTLVFKLFSFLLQIRSFFNFMAVIFSSCSLEDGKCSKVSIILMGVCEWE